MANNDNTFNNSSLKNDKTQETLTPILPSYLSTNFNDFNLIENESEDDRIQQFDKMAIGLPWNTDVSTNKQKLKSTSTTNTQGSLLLNDIKNEIEQIPPYLTKQNEAFQQLLHQARSSMSTSIENNSIVRLREIALLIYKMKIIQTYQFLWTTYLKSGLGQLTSSSTFGSTTISIWPKELKALLSLTDDTNANNIYLNFVHQQLHALDQQLIQYNEELNSKAMIFNGYTLDIQKIIETYIEQHLQSFRRQIEHQIDLIHCDYQIRMIKAEYFQHNPTTYQKQFMEEICRDKYNQEITEQEYEFLKQQISHYNSSAHSSFECSPIAQSELINSIQNVHVRQQLYQQYKEVAIQSRTKLLNLHLKTAKQERAIYQKKYEDIVKQILPGDQSIDNNKEIIPPILIQLINQRCQKISERIQYIYKFKTQTFLSQTMKQ